MAKTITDIEGIGPVHQKELEKAGIKTVDKLLEKGCTRAGRKEIAKASGVDEKRVLDWVNMADLFRINGIASQFAELLKASGVETVKELRTRNAEHLHAKLEEVNAIKKLTRVVPSQNQVEDFIEKAKNLEPMVTY